MKNKSNRGGQRTGAGRKISDDPKLGITIQIRKSQIEKLGGKSEARTMATEYLNSK